MISQTPNSNYTSLLKLHHNPQAQARAHAFPYCCLCCLCTATNTPRYLSPSPRCRCRCHSYEALFSFFSWRPPQQRPRHNETPPFRARLTSTSYSSSCPSSRLRVTCPRSVRTLKRAFVSWIHNTSNAPETSCRPSTPPSHAGAFTKPLSTESPRTSTYAPAAASKPIGSLKAV